MLTPYYEQDDIVIYHGDCREVMPQLGQFDLLLTDPQYGIAHKWVGGMGRGWLKDGAQREIRNGWDATAPDRETIDLMLSKAKTAIVWGGNYFPLPPSRCWLVWNKPERGFTLAEAELAWSNADNVVRVCDCNRHEKGRQHPTQKPVKLMKWCMTLPWANGAETILDPFMGSGTTLVAAKQLGKQATGIDINERYCEMAANRLRQKVLFS